MGDQLHDDCPSSASSDDEANKLPSQMMLSRIRVYWSLKSIFDILPKHSYDPHTEKQSAPFRDYPRLLRASGTTTSLSAILNTLCAERDSLCTRNETLFSTVGQNTARRPPRTQEALSSLTYQHMIADRNLIQAELELNRVRQQRSHAYANQSGTTEELEVRVVRAEIEAIRQKEMVLELTARRLGINTRCD